jgi:hypothetical protein
VFLAVVPPGVCLDSIGRSEVPCKAVFDRFAKPIRRADFAGTNEFSLDRVSR